MLFQMFYYLFHNGTKQTPLHVAVAETVHTMTRSKTLVSMLNRLGVSISYNSLERIDASMANLITCRLSPGDRVPLNKDLLTQEDPINAALDNFDSNDSHDTIMVLFQNQNLGEPKTPSNTMTVCRDKESTRERSAKSTAPCQELLSMGHISQRGKFSADFKPSSYHEISTCVIEKEYFMWLLVKERADNVKGKETSHLVPSFTATRAVLPTCKKKKVTTALKTPILPYRVTNRDAVFTAMMNFKDVLRQMNKTCGALWCDEANYVIAREIQMFRQGEMEYYVIDSYSKLFPMACNGFTKSVL